MIQEGRHIIESRSKKWLGFALTARIPKRIMNVWPLQLQIDAYMSGFGMYTMFSDVVGQTSYLVINIPFYG